MNLKTAVLLMGFMASPTMLLARDTTHVRPAPHRVTVRRDTFVDKNKDGVNDLRSRQQERNFMRLIQEHSKKRKKK